MAVSGETDHKFHRNLSGTAGYATVCFANPTIPTLADDGF